MRWLATVLAATTLTCGVAYAQEWPTRPVHLIVPQSPGSASDVVSRAVMAQVSNSIGQPIVIENRPGAGNTLAMAAVARAEPDGYTVLVNSATHSLVPATFKSLPFDTFRDLTPVIPLGNTPMVMVVKPSKGYGNIADFVKQAKARNGATTYSGGGAGSIPHLAAEAFRLAAGFDGVHVPFRGAPEALTEVIAGRVDFYFSPLPPVMSLLKDGQLQPLAVSGSSRASALPDVPTMKEAGFPEATYNFWIGLFLPSKTPNAIIERLRGETDKALRTQAVAERLATLGVDPLQLDRAAFAKLLEEEFAVNTRVVKAAGLQIN